MTAVRYNLGFVAFNNSKDVRAMILLLDEWSPPGLNRCMMVDHSTETAPREVNQKMANEKGWEYEALPNKGFGAGVNRLASMSKDQEVLVVLNLDVLFREAPPFQMMAEAVLRGGFSWVGTSILNKSGVRVAGRLPALNLRVLSHNYQIDLDKHGEKAISWEDAALWDGAVHGGCFAVRVSDFNDVGGIDESLFLYAEEFDLFAKFKKAQRLTGFLVSSAIIHSSEGSFDSEKHLLNRYNLRYLAKRERKWMLWIALSVLLCRDIVRITGRVKMKPLLFSNLSRPALLIEMFPRQSSVA